MNAFRCFTFVLNTIFSDLLGCTGTGNFNYMFILKMFLQYRYSLIQTLATGSISITCCLEILGGIDPGLAWGPSVLRCELRVLLVNRVSLFILY
jgi:hypothetical protein